MTASELTRHIEKSTGKMFVSAGEITKLGFGKDAVRELCKGLDAVTTGQERKCRKYYVGDVAKAIISCRILHD